MLFLILSICFFAGNACAQAVSFPCHNIYNKVSILPNCYNQQQLDSHVASFYKEWKAQYIKNDCDPNEYYVWYQDLENKNENAKSISEAQGYGMIITAFMAGYDKDAKKQFDKLYTFAKNHPSSITNSFMAWRQTDCDDTKNTDKNSATDGDMDIAYALLLAHNQWKSNGTINYLAEAKKIINDLFAKVINQNSYHILLGDWVDEDSKKYDGTRTSDFMCNHFEAFAKATNNKNWLNVSDACYTLLEAVQKEQNITTGLFPDFIEDVNNKPTSSIEKYLETKYDGEYYYNACRVPFRLSLHYLLNGEKRAKKMMDNFNDFMRSTNNNDPQNIETGYFLNGDIIKKAEHNSSAFIGSAAIAAMVDGKNQQWLNDTYNLLLLQKLNANSYYDNTLKMLYLIVLSGNWWAPN